VLRRIPGISVLQWTNDVSDVAVRGYNQAFSPRLLVLVDGRQVYADYYGYTPWSTLPVELSDIRQIEVVEGPNSALFGFNAVGGVINIVTYDPLYDDVNTASVTAGTQNLYQGSLVATYRPNADAGIRLSLGARRNDDFSTPQGLLERGTREGHSRFAANFLAHVRFGPKFDASLEATHSEVHQNEVIPLYVTDIAEYHISSLKASLGADTQAGLLGATGYVNWFHASGYFPGLGGLISNVTNTVYVGQLSDLIKISPEHTVRLSLEYRHNEMPTTPIEGGTVSYDVRSAALMWSWAITPDLSLTNAVRIDDTMLHRSGAIPPSIGLTNADWNNRSLMETSFNSGLVWNADEKNVIRLIAARGVQIPSLVDLGAGLLPAPAGYGGGLPYLQASTVMNYGLDWDHTISDWQAELCFRAFYQSTTDVLAIGGGPLVPVNLVWSAANIGDSSAAGVEFSLQGRIGKDWSWGLGYTAEAINDQFKPGFNVAVTLADCEHTNPVHIMDASLGWAHGPWEINGHLRYSSDHSSIRGIPSLIPSGSLVHIPGYVTADARIACQLTDKLTLAVSGDNLLTASQRQTSSAAVERQVMLTLSANL
jgi:outer membrane receptor for ferrienterochelin and colicins